MLVDQLAREQALNPADSFIVQAPAGSGKTELLIQRFLSLLATVEQPEAIIAITFTKKAANEMRERLLSALEKAKKNPPPTAAHAIKTYQLAKAALACDTQKQWQLLKNPNRLNIQTIDALNYRLNKHMPILSGLGFSPDISQQPKMHYSAAVKALFKGLEYDNTWATSLKTVLLHLDNQFLAVENLLCRMLEKRDQWLPHLYKTSKMQRMHLEKALLDINLKTLDKLNNAFSTFDKAFFSNVLCFTKQYAEKNSAVALCDNLQLDNTLNSKGAWLALAELLLKKDNDWRVQHTKRIGLPSTGENKTDIAQSKTYKATLKEWLECHKTNALKNVLHELRFLPSSTYSEKQWQLVEALMQLLPVACAQLKLSFAQHSQIDYIENAQAALQALGDDENITDLALSLDYRLSHLLVDEFQDTSISQLRLIEKLIAQWHNGEGKTLFIVGDPMQSIYRFREADVGLFLQAKENGIKQLSLNPLTLSANFRSQYTIVDWVNKTFSKAFPEKADANTAAVCFSSAEATQSNPAKVSLFNSANTGKTVVDCIQSTLAKNPTQSIAILVRAKSHLQAIIPALQAANINYQAVEIEPLSHRSLIVDVMALTKALSHLADRTAWLSILKAPFCGLSLLDLSAISQNKNQTIFEALQTNTVSEDGQQRIDYLLPIFKAQIANRARMRLSSTVLDTWKLLQANRYYTSLNDQTDLTAFLAVLDQHEQASNIEDWPSFEEAINRLFANTASEAKIHLMTMHKSKGLEFDTVILPELQKKPGQNTSQLLLWQERMLCAQKSDLLLAPIKAREEKSCPLYVYLKRIEDVKLKHETTRLLYVACTRAKSNLYLLTNLETDDENQLKTPDPRSLLACIWETCQNTFKTVESTQKAMDSSLSHGTKRFTLEHFQTPATLNVEKTTQTGSNYAWHPAQAKIIGTVVHSILQKIAEKQFAWWHNVNKLQHTQKKLRLNALPECLLTQASEKIMTVIDTCLTDKKANWILGKHPEHHCEYALSGIVNGMPVNAIIDRWFIDKEGEAWVIDYKTLLSDTVDVETQLENYKTQLRLYQTLLAQKIQQPVQPALYFPVQRKLITLSHNPKEQVTG